MAKLTLHELMKELADDPGLDSVDKKRAHALARINEAGGVKALLGKEKKDDDAQEDSPES